MQVPATDHLVVNRENVHTTIYIDMILVPGPALYEPQPEICHNMMVLLHSNDHKAWIFQVHIRFSSMPHELTYAVQVAQAMCTDDDEETDKTIKPSTNGSRKAMPTSSSVAAPSDMLARVMMCGRGLGLGLGGVCSQGVCRQ